MKQSSKPPAGVVPKSPLLNKWMFKYLSTRENFFAYRRVPENVFLSRNGILFMGALRF